MKPSDYRAAFDAVPFREDFQRQTVQKLRQSAGQQSEKECSVMKSKRFVLVAAALSALLVVSAAAAVVMLRPADVARHSNREALAAAFESDKAINLDQSAQVGDYHVTLMGMVSGEGLSQLKDIDAEPDNRTYAVLALERTDGTAVTDDVPELTVTPLVEGYAPWAVNAWTLNGGASSFAEGGVLYYLFDCDNVEAFADHTVYLTVYPGTHIPPSAERFAISDDGVISVKPGQEAAMFVLPLDPSKADHALTADFLPYEPPAEDDAPDTNIIPPDAEDDQPQIRIVDPNAVSGESQFQVIQDGQGNIAARPVA